jgi:predicted GNAT superfamily acetyltransferase
MHIRPLTTIDDCRRVLELEKSVWGYTDAEDVVPTPILIVSVKRGGILLGAFDDSGEMKGFVYSMASIKDGRPAQWSHMLGVTDEARDKGLGARLKLAQRDQALAMGIELVEWTYDPLQALNAHLNFAKLGVVVEEYEENIYGESSSVLHRGTPTDRFVAEWHIATPHVERRIAAIGQPVARDASVGRAPIVNPSHQGGLWLEPGPADLSTDGRRLLVEIPMGFSRMQAQEPELALAWRLATREIFQTCFRRGYRAVDFFLNRNVGRGHYLLARENP